MSALCMKGVLIAYFWYTLNPSKISFSGPCRNNGSMPIKIEPSGPGILFANVLFLLPSNRSIIITTNIVIRLITVNVKYHIFESFKSITCKNIHIEYITMKI